MLYTSLCLPFSDLAPFLRSFFFFNDTATTEIYTLSLHDALPIYLARERHSAYLRSLGAHAIAVDRVRRKGQATYGDGVRAQRSEEHTSELQSHLNLVCRLLLEKKKQTLCCIRS